MHHMRCRMSWFQYNEENDRIWVLVWVTEHSKDATARLTGRSIIELSPAARASTSPSISCLYSARSLRYHNPQVWRIWLRAFQKYIPLSAIVIQSAAGEDCWRSVPHPCGPRTQIVWYLPQADVVHPYCMSLVQAGRQVLVEDLIESGSV